MLIDSAFVQSHLGVAAEIGRRWDYGTLSTYTPPGAMPDAAYTLQFDQATNVATGYGSFGIAVNDRVELGVSGSYQSALSTDVTSALIFGSKSAWTLRPGARFQLTRSATTAVALHLYGDFGGDNQQSPRRPSPRSPTRSTPSPPAPASARTRPTASAPAISPAP